MNDVIAVRSIYRTFRKISDNAHGNVKGVSGCLTPGSLHKVLSVANVYGSNFMDIGAGDGKPIAAALVSGANSPQKLPMVLSYQKIVRTNSSSRLLCRGLQCRCFQIYQFCHVLD
jgi:hypothetical protein